MDLPSIHDKCSPGFDYRFRAKREQLQWIKGHLAESRGQNLAVAVMCVQSSLDILHSEPSVDALSLRSDGISSITILSLDSSLTRNVYLQQTDSPQVGQTETILTVKI